MPEEPVPVVHRRSSIDVSCLGGQEQHFDVVSGRIPVALLPELQRDFTREEIEHIYTRVHKTLAPSVERPAALFVFGPSAVGKSVFSSAQATALFGSEHNAVLIDGAEFREVHAGWQAVAEHGQQQRLLHADAWTLFRNVGTDGGGGSGISSRLKKRLLNEALRDRQHLIIPDCCNQPTRLSATVEQIVQAGYELHAICLWAPLAVTRSRGEPRSMREGKLWSPDEYSLSTRGSLAMALQWTDGLRDAPSTWRSLALWDNTQFPAEEISLQRFVELVTMDDEEAAQHAARAARLHAEIHMRVLRSSALALGKLKRRANAQREVEAARCWASGAAASGANGAATPVACDAASKGPSRAAAADGIRAAPGLPPPPGGLDHAPVPRSGEGRSSRRSSVGEAICADGAGGPRGSVVDWRTGNPLRFARPQSAIGRMAEREKLKHRLQGALSGFLVGALVGALLGVYGSLSSR